MRIRHANTTVAALSTGALLTATSSGKGNGARKESPCPSPAKFETPFAGIAWDR